MWNIRKIVNKGDYLYALVPEHPKATKNGYVLLHRVIIENHLGHLLNADEIVHHKDRNKKNNDISNLEVVLKRQHSKFHALQQGKRMVLLKCPWCENKFTIARNKSFLVKKNALNCNCCSTSCRGKMSRYIQLHGRTAEVEGAISENLLGEFKRHHKDNSEEISLQ